MKDSARSRTSLVRKPSVDDRHLMDVVMPLYALPAVLIAHKLGLYELLGHHKLTTSEIASRLSLQTRPTEALLSCCVALGLIRERNGGFALTLEGAAYLLKESPTYWGPYLEFWIDHRAAWSLDSLEKSIRSNSAHGPEGSEWIAMQTGQDSFAKSFTHVMHSGGVAPALAWPAKVDLSRAQMMLDIGGGSGAHSIGAVLRWKRLNAIVFDIPAVCEVAAEYALKYDVRERISTHAGDMWSDPFPSADVHFYSQVFHDWPPEKCRELTAKSFASLKSGGRLILHEMLFNRSKGGPLATSGMSMAMIAWTQGQQFSGSELSAMLRAVGFRQIQVKPTFAYWSIVTGVKP